MGTTRNGRQRGRRRIPLGQPLRAATEETAVISQADIDRARAAWLRLAPPAFRDLLDAEIVDGVGFE